MSWITETWSQDDSRNFGFPFPTDTGTVPPFDGAKSCTVWAVQSSINFGFPHIKSLYNRRALVDGKYIRRPLMVYPAKALDFSRNGYQVLTPTKAEDSLDFGTFGEIIVEHPIDKAGAWKAIKPNEIILAPCKYRGKDNPQPYRIYRIITKMSANGEKTVTAYARHILYDMNEALLMDVRPTDKTCPDAIAWLFSNVFNAGFEKQAPDYVQFYSNITTVFSAEYQRISLTNALIGADNSILSRWNGELYRNGLYFSICDRMENSRENAFRIRYSVEMTEVSEEIDYTDYCTYLTTTTNAGGKWDWFYYTLDPIPHVRAVQFNYETPTMEQLGNDSGAYWDSVSRPRASYQVKFADLHKDSEFQQLQTCEVGDTGQIYNPVLDIDTVQRITHKRTNLLTGETLEVRTGEQTSFVRKSAWSDTVTSGAPSAIEKQLDAEILSNLTTWGQARKYTWSQVRKFTWSQAGET